MHKEWRPIPGYEMLYEVSNEGDVRRSAGGQGSIRGRELTKKHAPNGYYCVDLSKANVKKRFGIHRLVAMAFIPNEACEQRCWVNHRDGDKQNNHVSNLEWTTPSENAMHAVKTGLTVPKPLCGESNGMAKLTAEQVREIKTLRGKEGARSLAQKYGVARSLIQRIHQGKAWSSI